MPDNQSTLSPIVRGIVKRASGLVRGKDEIISAELGIGSVDYEKTSLADSRALRKARTANSRSRLVRDFKDDRRDKRYKDLREMADEVPELTTSLDVLSHFVFSGDTGVGSKGDADGPSIVFSDSIDPKARSVVETAFSQLRLPSLMYDVFREGMHLGDSFSELVYTKDRMISHQYLKPDTTDVSWDAYGRLYGYNCSIGGSKGGSYGVGRSSSVGLNPWQVIHYAPDRPRGFKYGRSNWHAARKLWRISQSTLDVTAVLAILRASSRKTVSLPVPAGIKEDEINDWIDKLRGGSWRDEFFDKEGMLHHRIASALELEDTVYPYRAGTDKPNFHNEPSADLDQLVNFQKFLQESYFVATGVPAALCGLERNVNARSTLEQQGQQFVHTVTRRQSEISSLARDVLERACLAAGFVVAPGDFKFEMPDVSAFDQRMRAEVWKLRSETASKLINEVQMDENWVFRNILRMTPSEADSITNSPSSGQGNESYTAQLMDARDRAKLMYEQADVIQGILEDAQK